MKKEQIENEEDKIDIEEEKTFTVWHRKVINKKRVKNFFKKRRGKRTMSFEGK